MGSPVRASRDGTAQRAHGLTMISAMPGPALSAVGPRRQVPR